MKLGVFDSGIGGRAVAEYLQTTFPEATIVTAHDAAHVPYGGRSSDEVINLTTAAIQPLLAEACDVIIIACNTATAAAIETLRQRYPDQQFIGFEPMVRPAAEQTKTGTVAVFATPSTLKSERYQALKSAYPTVRFLEPDCSTWAAAIENKTLAPATIIKTVQAVTEAGADVIVLGCTHYHWIYDIVATAAGDDVTVLEPSEAIARRVQTLMQPADQPQQ